MTDEWNLAKLLERFAKVLIAEPFLTLRTGGFRKEKWKSPFLFYTHLPQPHKEGLNYWRRQNLLNNKDLSEFALLNKEYFWWTFWLKDSFQFLFVGQGKLKRFLGYFEAFERKEETLQKFRYILDCLERNNSWRVPFNCWNFFKFFKFYFF